MNSDGAVFQYFQIAETIKNRIRFGDYKPYQIIPSEKDLAREFGVSEITIRKALDILVQERWVSRKRGVGTKILEPPSDRVTINITGDFQDWFDSASGKFPEHLEVEILSIETTDGPNRSREVLGIPEKEPLWKMRRLRKHKEEPFSYYINWAHTKIFSKIDPQIFLEKTLFETIQDTCNIPIDRIEQRVEAIRAGLDLSKVLNIQFGDPLFYCENIYCCQGQPVEFTQIFYRGDRYVYKSIIHR